ncbi:MAG TPA: zinc-dependent alcohol dehydrogenase family protein [Rhizomicrobium sp.]|jgi:propanol-preferring alcohol dehydrogenase
MRAMVFDRPGAALSYHADWPMGNIGPHDVLLRVHACGVCRTDLHVVDGELNSPKPAVIPGHEIVGTVEQIGPEVEQISVGQRVGVPWLGWTCGECEYCRSGRENLCERARFNGYTLDGGYAEYSVADERYCFSVPDAFSDVQAAPLLCAGLIGYRALRFAGDAPRIGLYGFGAAAHLAVQVAHFRGQKVFAFTRRGDTAGQAFARSLGAVWAGESDVAPPEPLDAALIFAPVGALVPTALAAIARGGSVICAGIHMSDIPSFSYDLLWGERVVRSVANLTRRDGDEFLALATAIPVRTSTTQFRLEEANEALGCLRAGNIEGAAVLVP